MATQLWGLAVSYNNVDPLRRHKGIPQLRNRVRHIQVESKDRTSLTLRIQIREATPERAIQRGLHILQRAVAEARLTRSMPNRIEVEAWEGVDLDLQESDVSELLGVAEVAEVLGLSKQRVSQLSAEGLCPPPVAVTAAGPIWRKTSIARYANQLRRTGRPRRKETAGQRLRRHLRDDVSMHSHSVWESSDERVFLWVCVPGPRGVTYVMSEAQTESLLDYLLDGKNESGRKAVGDDVIKFIESKGWDRRKGFWKERADQCVAPS